MSGQEALRKLERMMVDEAIVGERGLWVRSDPTPEQESIFQAFHPSPPSRVEPLVANSTGAPR